MQERVNTALPPSFPRARAGMEGPYLQRKGGWDVGLGRLLSTSAPAPSVGQLLRAQRAGRREPVNVGFITGVGQRRSLLR